ncbi:hypothetical protein [Thermoanaerobacterium sp. RBIITD]|uniref:hypothetical protein n=1 Tax=Thermoanaerobacterium sp. RBIITD TaxID=1550240 RepID=UPI000BC02AB6|nr:hypothetical protein [Thermoanaerobacterium sp. RBIITD]SNX54955.1 hypothetical protein SAMN05660242_2711 [Thermoanaerobacterium sp. RBIITD]
MELFGLASYKAIGGKNTEIFVRINNPMKLRRFVIQNYFNLILTEIEMRRKRPQEVLIGFMSSNLSDEERCNVIENDYLGRYDEVTRLLK